jgi:predicted glutamine amidotransferase
MCGIGGFSLTARSKINSRKLAHALLSELELRGNQASGYAWATGRESGIFKKDVPGSKLKTFGMPKRAQNVILHTRMATHGTIRDMRNNHPVLSPEQNIALVHNGVIWNHDIVRKHVTGDLAEVDTSVIPATLEQNGLQGLEMLEGDAAIAWLDERAAGRLHVARVSHSPLVIANLKDGSFVFASTESILERALTKLKLEHEWVTDVKEYTALTVMNGIITDWENIPETNPIYEMPVYKHRYDYRSITNGSKAMPKWGDDYIGDPNYLWEEEPMDMHQRFQIGWNLDDNKWKYYDGYGITEVEDGWPGLEDEGFEDCQNQFGYENGEITEFAAFLNRYHYDERSGLFFDKATRLIGDIEHMSDMWDELKYSNKAAQEKLEYQRAWEDWD